MSEFWDLLTVYRWSLPASMMMAVALALIGAQWTARLKGSQIFVLGQGTSLGIVLGLALNIMLGSHFHSLSLVIGLSLGGLTLVLSERWIDTRADRSHVYFSIFVVFLAMTYLLTSLTPALESHMAASYFGDIAVMSDAAAMVSLVVAMGLVILLLWYWRPISLASFYLANSSLIHQRRNSRLFDFGTLVVTTLAIQNMGYLFTMAALFISTSFAVRRSSGLQGYTRKLILISLLGTGLGFLASLISPQLPTVPCVILGQVFCGVLFYTKK